MSRVAIRCNRLFRHVVQQVANRHVLSSEGPKCGDDCSQAPFVHVRWAVTLRKPVDRARAELEAHHDYLALHIGRAKAVGRKVSFELPSNDRRAALYTSVIPLV